MQPSPSALYCFLAANPAATLQPLGTKPSHSSHWQARTYYDYTLTGSPNRSSKGQEAAEQSIRIAKNAVTTVENLIFAAQQRILSASNHPMVAAARHALVDADEVRHSAREAREM